MSALPSPSRVCLFRLADQLFALDIQWVREVVEITSLSPIPLAPAEVLGVFSVRGAILPLVKLSALLGLEDRPSSRAIVTRHGDRQVALAIDEALGLETLEVIKAGTDAAYGLGYVIWRGQRVPVLNAVQLLESLSLRVQNFTPGQEAQRTLN